MEPTTTCLLKPQQSIVFEGDSLTSRRTPPALDTWPYLRLNNWHITYAERLSDWLFCNLPELRLRFCTSAVGGSTIRDVLRRYPTSIKPARPDWLIMTLGSNDCAQQIPLDEFTKAFDDLCRQVQTDSGGRVVWICARPSGAYDTPDKNRIPYAAYRQTIEQTLDRYVGLVIDAAPVLAAKESALKQSWEHHTIYTGPDAHLNIIAAEIISTLILQKLGVITVNAPH